MIFFSLLADANKSASTGTWLRLELLSDDDDGLCGGGGGSFDMMVEV